MKKTLIYLVFIFISTISTWGQIPPRMGDSAFASLLTCGPGNEFYEVFGHTALRVCDSANHIDLVFNYGSFDDFENNFYLKFAKGQLDYCLMVQYFSDFMFEYSFFERQVWEQRLNLTNDELSSLFKAVVVNSLPENMYYSYDFFRDNCATRVQNMIADNLRRRDFTPPHSTGNRTSYRDLVRKYSAQSKPWWLTGIDVLLGARCDKPITDRQHIFAPIEMMNQYDTLMLSDGKPLAAPRQELLPDQQREKTHFPSPTLVFSLLLLLTIVLSLFATKKGWTLIWLDSTLFAVAGCIGVLLLFLWLGSDHWCAKWNFNILWANPLFIVLLCRLRKRNKKITIAILACLALMLLIWLIGWPQIFNITEMLFALTLAVRAWAKIKN